MFEKQNLKSKIYRTKIEKLVGCVEVPIAMVMCHSWLGAALLCWLRAGTAWGLLLPWLLHLF